MITQSDATILIVDDETNTRKLLHRLIENAGYSCIEASSTEQALHELGIDRVELVILDIKMPGKSGVELLPEVRAKYPDTAVIMATAINNTQTAIQCIMQGAYDYITKPFDLDEVTLSIDRALQKRRLKLESRDYQQHLKEKVEVGCQ